MPMLEGIRPHPAFPLDVLPCFRRGTAPHSAFHEQHKPVQKGHRQVHYPRDYLESLGPLHQSIDGVCDVLAYVAMLAASLGSLLLAILNPLWIVDSALLNTSAFFKDPNQTIFLRRVLVLEGVAWTHGLAVAYSAHLRGLLRNKARSQLVDPMLGEFHSHRIHLLSLQTALQPSIFTRVLIVALQAIVLPIYFSICLVYPPACHSIAKMIGALAVRLYSAALQDADAYRMSPLQQMKAPYVAQWFYGLSPDAPFTDVLLCIRADDVFHSLFNEICYECHCVHPASVLEKHLDLRDVHVKGQ